MITNTLNELCARDDHMAMLLAKQMRALEGAFCTLIERGQATGDIAPWRDARATARSFLATAQGIQTLAKLNPGFDTINDIAATALALLD